MSCTKKMAEPIEMQFGMLSWVVQGKRGCIMLEFCLVHCWVQLDDWKGIQPQKPAATIPKGSLSQTKQQQQLLLLPLLPFYSHYTGQPVLDDKPS